MLELNTVKKETLKMVGVDEGRRVDILSVKFSHVVMVIRKNAMVMVVMFVVVVVKI